MLQGTSIRIVAGRAVEKHRKHCAVAKPQVIWYRRFASTAPTLWSSVPLDIRNADSLNALSRMLKTHYLLVLCNSGRDNKHPSVMVLMNSCMYMFFETILVLDYYYYAFLFIMYN